jgi:serine phosphatase RsbU (regulator of sigma subunit)/pSer/pThr/pTyr-binding forkhead associated (FHA) protein
MASLQILKGPNEGQVIPLDTDRFVIGRNPDCGIVIPLTSVSREHAQVVRKAGKFFIEDKQSRNGTFVNNQPVNALTALKNNDRIRICDFIACFLDQSTPAAAEAGEDDSEDGPSTVEATVNQGSGALLEGTPAEKLRLLIDISNNLSRTLELQSLFPKIADSLFSLFRQADRCFLITAGEGDKLQPRLVKTRRAADEGNAKYSRSIVRKAIDSAAAFLSDDATRDDRVQLSQSVVDFRIRSVMCAPMCKPDGKAFGVIQLDTQDRSKKFSKDDLTLLCAVANQAAISLENARMLEETVAQEKTKRDLALAREVQKNFLPKGPPQVPGYAFHGFYEAAKEVGGDYYGYIPLPDGKIVVAVGDVAGKGVPASLVMAKLASDIRFSMLSESNPALAMAKLNDLLYELVNQMDRFVTLVAVILDPATHTVTMMSGGHSSPLLHRTSSGEILTAMPKDIGGPPLGMIEGLPFDTCQARLEPGDCLLMFTDGVDESMNVRGERFELEGIHKVIKGSGKAGPKELVEKLVQAVKAHARDRDPHDDITVVALGRTA